MERRRGFDLDLSPRMVVGVWIASVLLVVFIVWAVLALDSGDAGWFLRG